MTPADRSAAQAALDAARPVYYRLNQVRSPEDVAADIIELWGAAEAAMRALLGGSSLSGQGLVRDLRQRDDITLAQANALASFHNVRSRVDDTTYRPTLDDITAARAGFQQLESAVRGAPGAPATTASGPAPAMQHMYTTPTYMPAAAGDAALPLITPPPRRLSAAALAGIAAVALIVIALGAYAFTHTGGSRANLATAIADMQSGRREVARAEFATYAHDHPDQADPHIFLARLARQDGDDVTAKRELDTAIRLEPTNARALRELGLLLLSENNVDLARAFLTRAVQADTADVASQGYLGCALVRLNRVEEGQRFLNRAGPGSWADCARAAPAAAGPRSPIP